MDILAPGSSVRLATNTSNTAFTTDNGTSFASPLTAGVAALYRGQNPNATVSEVKTAILSAAASSKISGYLGATGNIKYYISMYGSNSAPSGVTISVACH